VSGATILLTGATGQLGFELQRSLAPHGEVIALGRRELDMSDAGAIADTMRARRPQLIVNAASYTAVDRAESDAAAAHAINATAPDVLAGEARRLGATLIHFSTDYVFDGGTATRYTDQTTPHPISVQPEQARRRAGDRSVGVRVSHFRTSWVYGERGGNSC
jgi:dTDP-4-dehydrorhamnose reductase